MSERCGCRIEEPDHPLGWPSGAKLDATACEYPAALHALDHHTDCNGMKNLEAAVREAWDILSHYVDAENQCGNQPCGARRRALAWLKANFLPIRASSIRFGKEGSAL